MWGERCSGWFASYVTKWQKYGSRFTCWDPILMRLAFRRYSSVSSLAGDGIICLTIRKDDGSEFEDQGAA